MNFTIQEIVDNITRLQGELVASAPEMRAICKEIIDLDKEIGGRMWGAEKLKKLADRAAKVPGLQRMDWPC